jgi:phospholipid:diacylglycerol acyltransferase
MILRNYSYGIERDEEALKRNDLDHTKWTNPLESRHVTLVSVLMHGSLNCITFRLPNAPSLQIYCVYGHGKETEVSI